jgi:hypothetical protein
MTARTMINETLEIATTPGDDPLEVLASYLRELSSQGHDMQKVVRPPSLSTLMMKLDHAAQCKGCGVSMRVYFLDDKSMSIFSDFAEQQCQRRQMNVMSLMQR